MTVETNTLFAKERIQAFSDERKEPEWFRAIRLNGLEQMETAELPKPDKTKIDKWNFTQPNTEVAKKARLDAVETLAPEIQLLIGEKHSGDNLLV